MSLGEFPQLQRSWRPCRSWQHACQLWRSSSLHFKHQGLLRHNGTLPCAECVELSLLALNSTETVLSETVMLCSTPDAVMLDGTLANLHSSLVPWETRMHFQRCVVFVTIYCCSSVMLQLMHECLYTAPSHLTVIVAAWEVLGEEVSTASPVQS